MAKRVSKFLTNNSVLYSHQFGFRQKYSTALALVDVIDDIYSHLENRNFVLGLYLDLQKAFDTVDHSILLWKLNNYGIRGIPHSWFTSYLHNRKQFTSMYMVTVLINCQLPVVSLKDMFWGHCYFSCMLMICHILFLGKNQVVCR